MVCKLCGQEMELHHSSTDEEGNLYLDYRCSCGYQDGKVVGKKADEPERKSKPTAVNKWD